MVIQERKELGNIKSKSTSMKAFDSSYLYKIDKNTLASINHCLILTKSKELRIIIRWLWDDDGYRLITEVNTSVCYINNIRSTLGIAILTILEVHLGLLNTFLKWLQNI